MPARLQFLSITVGILLLGGALRFYGVGDWPFANDETATLLEERAMFHGEQVSRDNQLYRLPHIIPLSYLILHVGNMLFGSDEFGSRIILAMIGTVSLGAIFIFLDGLMGRPTAIAVSLLVTLWPEHVFQSQQTRFYIIAALFSFLCMQMGAYTLRRGTILHSVLTCLLALAAILSHSLMAVLLPIVFIGMVTGSYAERRSLPKPVWQVFLAAVGLVVIFFKFYLFLLISGWNQGSTWGYSVGHSVLASVNMLGWPVAVLAGIGLLLMIDARTAQSWYWATCAVGWAVTTIIFPIFVTYHPGYVFALALGPLVLAGHTIGMIFELLKQRGLTIGAAWVSLACLMNLPSLASHYADGSRPDMRTAAEYVYNNWMSGDRVTGFSMGLFRHYAPLCDPAIPLPQDDETIPRLKELVSNHARLWIVLQSGRGGLTEDLQRWLFASTSHKLQVRHRRFDYAEYFVDVFLYTPPK